MKKDYGTEGWYVCSHCEEQYFQSYILGIPFCQKCKDHPPMIKQNREYKYYYREVLLDHTIQQISRF